MSCARCGCGIYKTEEFISLNKVWHKYCFTCYQCNKRLDKDCAKIFQGELFCECCYTSVIEKLFEVISTPSVNKPCKVLSTPSCCVSKTFVQRLKNCDNCLDKVGNCIKEEYCFPVEKKGCIQRTAQSCSCIPSQKYASNEYCFVYPIPREVANYYNRSHMKTKACKDPVTCCPLSYCPACSCRKTANKCCCDSCRTRCGNTKRFCCSKPSSPCTPVFKNGCDCCLPEPDCCDPCITPQRCISPPHCQTCQCCRTKCCKPSCSPRSSCPPAKSCKQCCPPPNCSSPKKCTPTKCCAPPSCPPVTRCPPKNYCSLKMEGCCEMPCYENTRSRCNKPPKFCCRTPKYCGCGNLNPCNCRNSQNRGNCKMSQIRAQCTACCVRCEQKVYAAEKILVSCGAYHTSCFTCYCCNKCLDVKNVLEGCGEIYCKHCYNHFFGIQYYGFGGPNC